MYTLSELGVLRSHRVLLVSVLCYCVFYLRPVQPHLMVRPHLTVYLRQSMKQRTKCFLRMLETRTNIP